MVINAAVTPEPEKMDTVFSAEHECLKKRKVKKKSTFRYELYEHNGREKPFSKCSYGTYYRAAERLREEREQNEQEERERKENEQGGNEQEHSECVIMDCGKDICHVISQIKSFSQMGNEYALEVIHIDNTETSGVKVVYPYFENTLSKWLEKLDLPKETDEYDKWMQDEVFPKIRKLWQILLKMKENERNKPYCLPLINGVPKLLYINEEDDEKNKRDTSDDRSSLSNQGQSERELLDYPIKVLSMVVTKLQSSDESYKLPKYIEEAKEIWTFNPSKSKLLQGYPFLRIHPVLYKSYEKSRFLQLFYDITLEYKLSSWLDEQMHWDDFQDRIVFAKKKVYVKTLHYKSQNRKSHYQARSDQETRSSSQGYESYKFKKRRLDHYQPSSDARDQEQSDQDSLSSNQGQSNQKIPNYYRRGSYIVTFTRNVLTHFNDNDENSQGGRLAGDEIAETVDRDLAVCSLYYTYAKKIIADQSLKELMGENWQKAKEKLEEFLKSLK